MTDIPLNPALDEFQGIDCSLWPAGKTPEFIWACLAGIQPGDDYVAGVDPPVPNGIFKCEPLIECGWRGVSGPWLIEVRHTFLGTLLFVRTADPIFAFFDGAVGLSEVWFKNLAVDPANETYYGGWGFTAQREPDGLFSETNLAALAGIDRDEKTFAKVWPMPAEQAVHVINRDQFNDHIRILYDHT